MLHKYHKLSTVKYFLFLKKTLTFKLPIIMTITKLLQVMEYRNNDNDELKKCSAYSHNKNRSSYFDE